jgi:TolB protein
VRRQACGFGLALLGLILGAGRPDRLERLTTDGLVKQRPSWSRDGKHLTFARHERGGTHIWQYVMDAGSPGSARRVTTRPMPDFDGVFSPDGARLLLVLDKQSGTDGNLDLGLVAIEGGDAKVVVGDIEGKRSHQEWPAWSPDGQRFAFASTHDGNQEIYTARADGTDLVRVTQSPGLDNHPCWTPDGAGVLFTTDRWGGLEIARVQPDGSGVVRLTKSRGLDDYPAVSPDGKRVAFVSNRDGNFEVYVCRIDGSAAINVSKHPRRDTMPTWTPGGESLTFVSERDGGSDLYTLSLGP